MLAASVGTGACRGGPVIYVRPTRTVNQHFWRDDPPVLGDSGESVAVLHSKTSRRQESARFADGMRRILTDLARIADLKVISARRDAIQDEIAPQSARIGQQLWLAHLLEGSVQRRSQSGAGEREVDRCADRRASLGADLMIAILADVFAIQSEMPKP